MSTSRGQYILDYIDVENWDVVYAQWKAQDITADEAAVKLGISKATLYRMEKRRIKESQTASE
jgi:predicted DNA-binding protein (UPF0251 family)